MVSGYGMNFAECLALVFLIGGTVFAVVGLIYVNLMLWLPHAGGWVGRIGDWLADRHFGKGNWRYPE